MEQKFLVRNFQTFQHTPQCCPLHSSLKIAGNSSRKETKNNPREKRRFLTGIYVFLMSLPLRPTAFNFLLLFSAEKPQFLVVCEGKSGIIACQEGKKISILDANYGRLDRDTCLHRAMSNINCRASSSLQIVQGKCNGKTECHLQPSNSVFGGDPCGGTFKYLQVKYRCQQEL